MENYFSKNLKYLREKRNMDQQALADNLNIPRSTLTCWENNIRTPKISQIINIADYFNVTLDIIYKDYSRIDNNDNIELSKIEFKEEVVNLLNKVEKIDPKDKNMILSTLNYICDEEVEK